jgi:hypothetical protein
MIDYMTVTMNSDFILQVNWLYVVYPGNRDWWINKK